MYTSENDVPPAYSALVLGASVYSDNRPSPILADRIKAAVALYKKAKVKKLLMSGDNRTPYYNEPDVMKRMAISLGVPAEDIQADYAGRRTYDSCWRAKNIFSQDKMIIVTQSFHMSRALFLCSNLGIESYGLVSDQPIYSPLDWTYWQVRDVVSLILSIVDLFVRHPSLVKGDKIQL